MFQTHASDPAGGRFTCGRRFTLLLAALLLTLAIPVVRAGVTRAAPIAATPQALVQALASTPLSASELPAGFSQAGDAQDVSSDVAGLAPGLVGAVVSPLSGGSSTIAALAYAVFDTADDASAGFNTNLSLVPGLSIASSSTPPGFDSPAMLDSGALSLGGFGEIGASACSVLAGNVVVVGISAQFGSTQGGSSDDACAVAQAGITHLSAVIANS